MLLLTVITWSLLGLSIYVYAGYPLLLAILARIRRRPIDRAEITPRVSLIVAAYNEDSVIAAKLENSLSLDYPTEALEIIVVADGSTDGTAEIVRGYADRKITLLHSPERRGKSAALNRGVAQASGEILVFSDANALYEAAALKKLVRNFNDPQVGCVSGRKTVRGGDSAVGESEGAYWRYESYIKAGETQTGATVGVVGEMLALRAALFEPIPETVINDDAYLALRVLRRGFRVIYEPEARSWETPSLSTRDEVIRRQRMTAGRFQLLFNPTQLWPWNRPLVLFQLISHKFLRLLLPLFMLGAFVSNALLVALRTRQLLMYLVFSAQLAFYGLALLGFVAERRGRRLKLPAVAYYLTSSNLATFQGFVRYVTGKQTVIWEKAQRAGSKAESAYD